MISTDDIRQSLEEAKFFLSDEDILKLRDLLYALAEIDYEVSCNIAINERTELPTIIEKKAS